MEPHHRAQYEFMAALREAVRRMPMKDVRIAFGIIRATDNVTSSTFMPRLGLTTGQFATYHELNGTSRKGGRG